MVTKAIDHKWIYSLDRYAVFFLVGEVCQYPAYAHVQQYMGALAYGFCCTSFSDVIYLKTPFVNGLFHFICPVQSGNKVPTSWFGFCCHSYFLWMETNKMNTKYITDNNRLFVFLTNASILQSILKNQELVKKISSFTRMNYNACGYSEKLLTA